jgi:prefoldin subunit 5
MELSLNNKRMRMQSKEKDLSKSICSIEGLKSNPTAEFSFELNDTLYAKARLSSAPLETVHLWLGANVMLSYPVEEGLQLLKDKLAESQQILKTCEEDLLFLRDQITTMEVNTARVYNLFVQSKKQ